MSRRRHIQRCARLAFFRNIDVGTLELRRVDRRFVIDHERRGNHRGHQKNSRSHHAVLSASAGKQLRIRERTTSRTFSGAFTFGLSAHLFARHGLQCRFKSFRFFTFGCGRRERIRFLTRFRHDERRLRSRSACGLGRQNRSSLRRRDDFG